MWLRAPAHRRFLHSAEPSNQVANHRAQTRVAVVLEQQAFHPVAVAQANRRAQTLQRWEGAALEPRASPRVEVGPVVEGPLVKDPPARYSEQPVLSSGTSAPLRFLRT
jgi:hypothetical protein